MRKPLRLHPDSRCPSVGGIEVQISCPGPHRLALVFVVTGRIGAIRVPLTAPATRGEKLWQHTCFEAFVRASSGADYYEFNFSPSTQWAAYRFSGHRSGFRIADEVGPLSIEMECQPDRYTLQTSLDLSQLSGLPRTAFWRLGLSAVIEETDGSKSYWALTHPPGAPDFHHSDCFAHEFSLAV